MKGKKGMGSAKVMAAAKSGKDAKFADGGAVAFARGGKVSGMKPKGSLAKAPRSGMVASAGGMSASSPMSSAGNTKKAKGVGKPALDKEMN